MCDVAFPPEIFLDSWSEGTEGIVRVHDDVYPRVEQSSHHSCGGGGCVGVCVCVCVRVIV